MNLIYMFVRFVPLTCQEQAILVCPVTRKVVKAVVRWSADTAKREAAGWAVQNGYEVVDFSSEHLKTAM